MTVAERKEMEKLKRKLMDNALEMPVSEFPPGNNPHRQR